MGIPTIDQNNAWHQDAAKEILRIGKESGLNIAGQEFHSCEIGNRHLMFFLDHSDRTELLKIGPALQKSAFWDGINVHLCQAKEPVAEDHALAKKILGGRLSDLVNVLIWERGAGETQACGSGACAVAASILYSGLVERNDWIAIDMPGGRLYCRQADSEGPVTLAGPAQFVFEAVLEI